MEKSADLLLVAVCTYKRPNMLLTFLHACAKLQPVNGLSLALLVIDNDPNELARVAVEAVRARFPMPIHYRAEPERGIAHARNRVLAEACSLNASYLALIDDDEVMKPDWLRELHRILQESGADAVGAPAYWNLPASAPAWQHALPSSPQHESLYRNRKKKSKPWLYPSTNNVLMKAAIYRDLGMRFDVRFGMTGGEDTDFFARAKKAGARYAFTTTAAVLEHVPRSRLTLRWRFWRWAGVARGNVRMYRLNHGSMAAWRHYLPRSLPKFITGPALLLAAPIAGHEVLLRGLKHLGGSLGMLQELLGRKSEEYHTTHGN